MELPLWINKELLQVSLSSYLNENCLKVLDFFHKSAIPSGENYTTNVFRVNITFVRNPNAKEQTKENLSLILKCNREGLMEALAAEMNLFRKEIDMFGNILLKMNDICGTKSTFSAKCINASLTPNPYLMVEDMCSLGFSLQNRRVGLDLQHALKVLEKIASFHASSIVLTKQNPSVLNDIYSEGIFPNKESITSWMKIGFKMLSELAANCKELEVYHEKLKRITDPIIVERALSSWHTEADEFSVLNHGDFWINNMMFSYEANGNVKECKLVDFQLCVYGSPAIDLHYFLVTSLAVDIIKETEYLLEYYYAHLLMALTNLRFNLQKVPSLKDFKDDYRNRSFYGLLCMATVLALIKSENRVDANFEDLMTKDGKDSFRNHCYKNDVYKSIIIHCLPIYENYGVFL